MDAHSGSIDVVSQLGQGTTVSEGEIKKGFKRIKMLETYFCIISNTKHHYEKEDIHNIGSYLYPLFLSVQLMNGADYEVF